MTSSQPDLDQLSHLPPATLTQLLRSTFDTLPVSPDATHAEIAAQRQAALALIAGLRPRDAADALFAASISATYHAAVDCLRRAMLPEVPKQMAVRYGKTAIALSRALIDTVCTLKERQLLPSDCPEPAQPAGPTEQAFAAPRPRLRLVPRDEPTLGT